MSIPTSLLSRELSVMDVVDAVNKNNLILPAGDVKVGTYDYYVYSNALVDKVDELNRVPLKTVGQRWVSVGDVGEAKDAHQIQYNLVRVDGQRSAYLPIMKQGGDTNTIQVVDGIRNMIGRLFGVPKNLVATVVFDQSAYVKEAIKTLSARRPDRPGAHQPDDSDLSGQPARHPRRFLVDSAFRLGYLRHPVSSRQHDQYHDPGRAGAGFLPHHR